MVRWGKFFDHVLNCHQNGQFTPAKAGEGITIFSFKGDIGRRSFRYTSSTVLQYPAGESSQLSSVCYKDINANVFDYGYNS